MNPSALSHEDTLRLNVLMAGEVQAVRLDEARMTLHALTDRGEAVVRLTPNCGPDQYLRRVREFLGGHVLGSPGGYPVYLQRWTRMGQARDKGLDKLLLLGEPEAVISAAYSSGITDEIARRAWWAMPVADNARRMLERGAVAQGKTGSELAAFLIEHLPFETQPHTIIDTVRIVLQPGLITPEARRQLWNKGRHDNIYYVGFLERLPDNLPEPTVPHQAWAALSVKLGASADAGNPFAQQLLRTLSAGGQTFLKTVDEVLQRPADQDVVNAVLNAIALYFSTIRAATPCPAEISAIIHDSGADCAGLAPRLQSVLAAAPEIAAEARAMQVLSCIDSAVARPILSRTTAIGTLMRRKLEPLVTPLRRQIAQLRGLGA
ncbi:MAG TPA: sulfur reduction protein DsrS [Betaproteobacteria bacterium]|nr:sulfur reduction protein DsrS [Betaproteobacteria bacterium]